MSSQWKNLQSKYKFRRVTLIVLGVLLLIGLGWGLGNYFNINRDQEVEAQPATENLSIGESSPSEIGEAPKAPSALVKTPEEVPPASPPKDIPPWELLVVNKKIGLPTEFKVVLEKVSGHYQVDARVATPLKQMIGAARREGINLELVSAYRNTEEQVQAYKDGKALLLSEGISEEKAEEKLERNMAEAGFSEHQIGLGIDLLSPEYTQKNEDFKESLGYDWLEKNGSEYGFILRYPEGKEKLTFRDFNPWHYRYVGPTAAKEMQESDLCLEEYVAYKNSSYDLPRPKDAATDPKQGVDNPLP